MDRKVRLIAAILATLAGVLNLYNVISDKPAGAPWPLGKIAFGLFFFVMAVWIYVGGQKKKQNEP